MIMVKTGGVTGPVHGQAGNRVVTAADPLPDDLREALDVISRPS
jgi:hypothetical protein